MRITGRNEVERRLPSHSVLCGGGRQIENLGAINNTQSDAAEDLDGSDELEHGSEQDGRAGVLASRLLGAKDRNVAAQHMAMLWSWVTCCRWSAESKWF